MQHNLAEVKDTYGVNDVVFENNIYKVVIVESAGYRVINKRTNVEEGAGETLPSMIDYCIVAENIWNQWIQREKKVKLDVVGTTLPYNH